VAEGRAEIAALDALTFAMMQARDPDARALRVVAQTAAHPRPALYRRRGADRAAIRAALAAAPSPDLRGRTATRCG
jgi:ABC-type phosphate/phosphonate transport system substrate-binding protein